MSRQRMHHINKIIKMGIVPKSEDEKQKNRLQALTGYTLSGHIIQLKVNICYAMRAVLLRLYFNLLLLCIIL